MAELTLREIRQKLENFCAYQERCHKEVAEKLRGFRLSEHEESEVITHLIEHNFLNEERFARAFARGKHKIKGWGKVRIITELKLRGINQYNIKSALEELDDDDYANRFEALAEKHWETIRETEPLKKRKKFCDFLLRKGFESELVYSKAIALENSR